VDGEIDFTAHTEPELVEMFGRMDPRYAPTDCARLGKLLAERGYIVTDGETGPGYAVPSPAKLRALIGSSHPIEYNVDFGPGGRLESMHNDLGFVGSGKLTVDGISVWISGRSGRRQGLVSSLSEQQVRLPIRNIVNVESQEQLVRFEYSGEDMDDGAITVRLADDSAVARLVSLLPKERTAGSRPQIKVDQEFTRRLIAQSPKTPVTYAIIAINVLVFIATLIAGADWLRPTPAVQIAWGSNFGPYTSDGEWWRLVTSLFIHFGIAHVAANMIALAYFGPLVERLYGSVNYLFLYLFAGVGGSIASIAWHPDVNSAGASGAIFGLLGALLAALLVAQWRGGDAFPGDILRPIGRWALLFLGWNLYAGFTGKGIDYAGHIGGLTTGFLMGLTATHPVTGESSYTRNDLRHLVQTVPVVAALLAGGLWWAQSAATALAGEGLYWHTVHWVLTGEHSADSRFNRALALMKTGQQDRRALAEEVERNVLPFWRQASVRLATIELAPNSPYVPTLQLLRDVSDGRARAYELLSEGLRKNDIQEIAAAERAMKDVAEIAKERGTVR